MADEAGGGRAAALESVVGPELYERVRTARVLVVGAGGIGCELLKNLAMCGFGEVELVSVCVSGGVGVGGSGDGMEMVDSSLSTNQLQCQSSSPSGVVCMVVSLVHGVEVCWTATGGRVHLCCASTQRSNV